MQLRDAIARLAAGTLLIPLILLATSFVAHADTRSYTGNLADPTAIEQFTFTLQSSGTVSFQTFGFGGGTNAAGSSIAGGGTDPFLALFSGAGDSATIVTDALGNPYGSSLVLSNYGNPGFAGCGVGQANAPAIGGLPQCGDIFLQVSLGVGTYTVILSDGQYVANAVFDNGTLGEGFTDFTGGIFCNVAINGVDCPNTSGAYALDIALPDQQTPAVPEPPSLTLLATVVVMGCWKRLGTR